MSKLGTVAHDCLKVIEAPFTYAAKAEKVLATALKNEPELKTTIATLIQKCETIASDGVKDVAERGLNIPDDLATLHAIQDLGAYIRATVEPLIVRLYGELKIDVATATAHGA